MRPHVDPPEGYATLQLDPQGIHVDEWYAYVVQSEGSAELHMQRVGGPFTRRHNAVRSARKHEHRRQEKSPTPASVPAPVPPTPTPVADSV